MKDPLAEEGKTPPGFILPRHYVALLANEPLPDLEPWWLLAEQPNIALFWWTTLKAQYPTRSLVPFAKRDDLGDELAAFDGSDLSGDPRVFYVHAYTTPGWERRGDDANFLAWLENARREALEFKAK
jgi:hypothetical protein